MRRISNQDCRELREETMAIGISKPHASDAEIQPYLAGLLARHCEVCSGKLHRILRIQELMALGLAKPSASEPWVDPNEAWQEVRQARERGTPGHGLTLQMAFVVQLLMEEEERLRFNSPKQGLQAMQQALEIVERLFPDSGRDHLSDSANFAKRRIPPAGLSFRALVEARYGNALRYNSRHLEALPMLAQAALKVRSFAVPDLVRGEVFWLYAAVLTDTRQQSAALDAAHHSIDAYRSSKDFHRAAVVMMNLADILYRQNGHARDSLQILNKALNDLDPLRSPHMRYGCQLQCIAYCLRAGAIEEAERVWSALSPSKHETTELQRQYLGGLILLVNGQFSEALDCLKIVANRFLKLGRPNDATVLTLYKGVALLKSGQVEASLEQLNSAYEYLLTLDVCEPEKRSFKDLIQMARVVTVEQLASRIKAQVQLMEGCLQETRKTPSD